MSNCTKVGYTRRLQYGKSQWDYEIIHAEVVVNDGDDPLVSLAEAKAIVSRGEDSVIRKRMANDPKFKSIVLHRIKLLEEIE